MKKGIPMLPVDPETAEKEIPQDVPILFKYKDGHYEVHKMIKDDEFGLIVSTHESYADLTSFSHYAIIEEQE